MWFSGAGKATLQKDIINNEGCIIWIKITTCTISYLKEFDARVLATD